MLLIEARCQYLHCCKHFNKIISIKYSHSQASPISAWPMTQEQHWKSGQPWGAQTHSGAIAEIHRGRNMAGLQSKAHGRGVGTLQHWELAGCRVLCPD